MHWRLKDFIWRGGRIRIHLILKYCNSLAKTEFFLRGIKPQGPAQIRHFRRRRYGVRRRYDLIGHDEFVMIDALDSSNLIGVLSIKGDTVALHSPARV